MTKTCFCLAVLLLNQMAVAGLAQLEFQLPAESLTQSSSADWSGSFALGASAQFWGNPGGNATINLTRNSSSSTTKLFTGYFFGGDLPLEENLYLRSLEEQFFFQVRHEHLFRESKLNGYFQGDFDGTGNFNRTAFSAGAGLQAYRSAKFELSFRSGVRGFFGAIEPEHWNPWERHTITEDASGAQGHVGVAGVGKC